jgi:uncharacterized protein (DUF697 family)
VASLQNISSVWTNIKEVDLKPIRDAASHPVKIVIAGETGTGKHTLVEQMRTDPTRPGIYTQTPVGLCTFNSSTEPPAAHLTIILIDATQEDFSAEQALVKKWIDVGKNILVFFTKIDLIDNKILVSIQQEWPGSHVLYGSTNDIGFLQREFVPEVLELLPQQHLALGRQFPLFRLPIAHQIINDTCFSNAAYSFSTGVAQIVPVLDIPLTMTDMIILTKSQAFLAYKLGLLFGFSTRWQDYVTEFGGVIGGGFVWRQIARSLIGLIPVWGIIPKVAISYSGTYVVGHAILGWYITGRHLNAKQMRALSTQALTRGKDYARKLGKKLPHLKSRKRKQNLLPDQKVNPELPQGEIIVITENGVSREYPESTQAEIVNRSGEQQGTETKTNGIAQRTLLHKQRKEKRLQIIKRKKKGASDADNGRACIKCGKFSSIDAIFCQYCGNPMEG